VIDIGADVIDPVVVCQEKPSDFADPRLCYVAE